MPPGQELALVPIRLPARVAQPRKAPPSEEAPTYPLAPGPVHLHDRAEVQRLLPDILGRALALSWIDSDFRAAFREDPQGTLARQRITLPPGIRIEVVQEGRSRPMVVVSDLDSAARGGRKRLLYLQLVMVAGR